MIPVPDICGSNFKNIILIPYICGCNFKNIILVPDICGSNLKSKILKFITQNSSLGPCCEISLRYITPNPTNDKSTLVYVMALWCQAASHYVITITSQWVWWRLKSPASRLFTQPFIQMQIKENIKALRHWPLCGEFTGDRWIPRTNGQLRGKCFHLMTSSYETMITQIYDTKWQPRPQCVKHHRGVFNCYLFCW